jgi:hypothetical protein
MLMSEGYGSTTAEVAAYLVKREIDDLKRSGVLPRRAFVAAPGPPLRDGDED